FGILDCRGIVIEKAEKNESRKQLKILRGLSILQSSVLLQLSARQKNGYGKNCHSLRKRVQVS
ncbi:MAG: hypothetical protein NC203_01410, partial [Firmicutes bacterium]|nr:hypothetical protein [Bacillota bacterium]